ncbi:hypothetical protein GcM1_140010 [Golovinomyces cichoracearum]|uniref:Uncharacterized protein n=1 Tax=Golovinomyces cichoracearum TaxID=62708 RepID=A0A420JBL7_9PEZI|nr:hypothetical protein GcM1_140010 [Golovinomyces cichoracearum]
MTIAREEMDATNANGEAISEHSRLLVGHLHLSLDLS